MCDVCKVRDVIIRLSMLALAIRTKRGKRSHSMSLLFVVAFVDHLLEFLSFITLVESARLPMKS